MKTKNEEVFTMGRQLKMLRNSLNLTQEEFAVKLNVTKDTIYNYEKNKTAIPHDIIRTLCYEYHLSADYFYGNNFLPASRKEGDAQSKNNIYGNIPLLLSKLDDFDRQKAVDTLYVVFRERKV